MKMQNFGDETAVSPQSPPAFAVCLPIPQTLSTVLSDTQLSQAQTAALQQFMALPLIAETDEVLATIDAVLSVLAVDLPEVDTAVQRAEKFDIYDEFFKIGRVNQNSGIVFLHGLLLTYANALKNMASSTHTMSVIEIPLLRVAVESTLGLFDFGETT